jgi:hypothetical protein
MPDKNEQVAEQKAEQKTEPKICPFLNSPCLEEKCALSREFKQEAGGMMKKFWMCAFNATNLILSEMNQKTIAPQQPLINLPSRQFRG